MLYLVDRQEKIIDFYLDGYSKLLCYAKVDVQNNHLHYIYVDPIYRGLGLSIKLLELILHNREKLSFLNYNNSFWMHLKSKYSDQYLISLDIDSCTIINLLFDTRSNNK